MKKVLVTGGAGYIGSHTVVELASSGYEPIIVDNFINSRPTVIDALNKMLGREIKCYKADCRDKDTLTKIISEEDISAVIHFAAHKAVRESVEKPLKYYANNLGSMIGLLEAMQEANIDTLVFSSSCTVYGEPEKLPVDETSPLGNALAAYGTTKQICETMIKDQARADGLKAFSLRYFNAVGAHPSGIIGEDATSQATFLVPKLMQAAIEDKPFTVLGNDYPTPDGTCVRDYIHVVDLAQAHVIALNKLFAQKEGLYDAINLGVGRGYSVIQVIKAFELVCGKKINTIFEPRAKGDAAVAYADVKKASQVLGWQAEKTLEDALADAWRWQQALSKIH